MENSTFYDWSTRLVISDYRKRLQNLCNWWFWRAKQWAVEISIVLWHKSESMETIGKDEIRQKSTFISSFSRWYLCNRWIWWKFIHVLSVKIWVRNEWMDRDFTNERSQMHSFFDCNIRNSIDLCLRRVWFFAIKFSIKI